MVSHRNLIMLFKSVSQLPGYQTPDSWNAGWPTDVVVYLPGFHIAGFATMVISAIEGGMLGFAVSAPMDLKAIVQAIKQIRPYVSVAFETDRFPHPVLTFGEFSAQPSYPRCSWPSHDWVWPDPKAFPTASIPFSRPLLRADRHCSVKRKKS